MPATVADAIREGQRGIRALEPAVVADLLDAYDLAWHAVERILLRYERQIAEAAAAGVEPRPSWLRQQRWYAQMQQSIDAEMARFQSGAVRTLTGGQARAAAISAEQARLFAQAVGVEGGIVARVNAGAFERWVSAMRPNSPVRGVLDGYRGRVSEALAQRMAEGLGAGKGATGILRDLRSDVGTDAVQGRVHTFVRTETMRSYRGHNRDVYEAMGPEVVGEWEWRAGLSPRCCAACVAYHRRRFPFNAYPDRFHPACRCTVVAVPRKGLVPAGGPSGESGAEWFARQPEDVQRRILGTKGRYELYRQGVPIEAMTGVRQSRTWGGALYVKPAGMVTTAPISASVTRRPAIKGVPDIKSAQDAEAYMKRYTDTVMIGPQSAKSLQSIANGLESSAAPYGVRFSSIDLTTSTRKGRKMANGNYSRNLRAADDAPGRLEMNPSYTKSPAVAARSVRKAEDAFRANRNAEIAKYERYVADPARAQILVQNQQKLDTLRLYDKWSMSHVTDDPIRTTVIHEVGHAVYYQKNLGPLWESKVASLPPGVRPRVSQYGATNNSELFAETFAGYIEGVPMPQEMVKIMEEVLDGAK